MAAVFEAAGEEWLVAQRGLSLLCLTARITLLQLALALSAGSIYTAEQMGFLADGSVQHVQYGRLFMEQPLYEPDCGTPASFHMLFTRHDS